MKMTNTLTAVVVGDDHQNTLGVIRSLGEAGIRVKAVILSDGGFCATAQSKYIEEVFLVRRTELIDTLVRIGEGLEDKAALIPCDDGKAAAADQAYDRLSARYYLHRVAQEGDMTRLMNKMTMLETARSAGLNVPNWVSLEQKEFAELERLCGALRFPCILKPVGLLPGGRFEFRILQNMDELMGSMDYISRNCAGVIVQEYVNKTGEYGVNGCRLYHSGETVFCGVIEKKRFSQASLGSTTAGTIVPDVHGLCEKARKFVEAIDYRGIFDMEFISDGKDFYFVEMNFRNGGYGYACTRAGRNYPAIWAGEACGKDVEPWMREPLKTLLFINESADLQNVRVGNVSVFGWFWDVLRAGAHMYINRRDMKPLLKKIMR